MAMKKIGYHNLVVNVATGAGTPATITVFDVGTANASTIYSDASGTAESNPLTTDAVGRFSFFADPGEYDIQVSGAGITTYKLEGVSIIGEDSQFVKSDPSSGEHRVKELRLNAAKITVVTYDDVAEA
jgi:hypothetical protein